MDQFVPSRSYASGLLWWTTVFRWSTLLLVPQGSVLGPLLILLYTAKLFDFIADCGLIAHSYAEPDDIQVYIGTTAVDSEDAVDASRIVLSASMAG